MLIHRMYRVLFFLPAIWLAGCPQPPEELDAFLRFQMDRGRYPGLSACIVKNGDIAWSGAYGWADTEAGIPVTEATLFMLASVSKTVTATAVMQVYERGMLDLDADINTYLPFRVENPRHPGTAITARMLLAHTSSIRDNEQLLDRYYTVGDSPIALGDFLERYLNADGADYQALGNFYPYAPGENGNYSNIGMTLGGYLVEVVSGTPFDQFCEENIFTPLGMDEAGWFLADLEIGSIARPHQYNPLRREYEALEHYGYPDYPDGQLRATARAYGRFLLAFLNGGTLDGARILETATVDEMLEPPYPDLDGAQAHGWFIQEAGGKLVYGHSGGDDGVSTEAVFDPETNTGVVVLMNGQPTRQIHDESTVIVDRLLAEAETL